MTRSTTPWRRSPLLLTVLALSFLAMPACADWVWTPERGWHNPRDETRGTADQLYRQGARLFEAGRHLEAAQVFSDLARSFPGSRYAKRAQFYAGEAYFEAGELYEAYSAYEAYLRDYPESEEIDTIVEKEFEIGRAFLNGARRKTWGIAFLNLPSPATGIEILESVVKHSPYSNFADDAIYSVAEYYFREAKYREAAAVYRRLVVDYPDSEWATKSKYQVAQCSERMSGTMEYSSQALQQARKQLVEYSAENPEPSGTGSIAGQIAAIDDSLAEKMWREVQFYERADKLFSAGYVCKRLQARFPDSAYAAMAEQWIAEHPEVVAEQEESDAESIEDPILREGVSSTPSPRATPAGATPAGQGATGHSTVGRSTVGAAPATPSSAGTQPGYAPPPPGGATPNPATPNPATPNPATTRPATPSSATPAAPQNAGGNGGGFVPRARSTGGTSGQ